MTGKRHPYFIHYEVGFDDAGKIDALKFEQHMRMAVVQQIWVSRFLREQCCMPTMLTSFQTWLLLEKRIKQIFLLTQHSVDLADHKVWRVWKLWLTRIARFLKRFRWYTENQFLWNRWTCNHTLWTRSRIEPFACIVLKNCRFLLITINEEKKLMHSMREMSFKKDWHSRR